MIFSKVSYIIISTVPILGKREIEMSLAENSFRDLYLPYFDDLKEPNDEGFIPCICPFHDDHKASAGIQSHNGVIHCFTCGSFSPAQAISKLADVTLSEAIDIVDRFRHEGNLQETHDTFTVKIPQPNQKLDDLATLSQSLFHPDLQIVKEYEASRGITFETLQQNGCGFLPGEKTKWGRDSLVFPYFVNGHCIAIRYRDFLSNKGGEPSHFTLWQIDRLDEDPEVVILCEGETDALRTYQTLKGELPVLSTPTATFKDEWKREFLGVKQVILIPQDDEASMKMIQKAYRVLGDKLTVAKLPWRKKEFGNDAVDWLRYHSEEEYREFILSFVTPLQKRILTGTELVEAADMSQDWMVENLLARRQICIIGGQPKSMKTWLALNLVRTLLQPGELFCGITSLQSLGATKKVLFIEEEGPLGELKSRAEKVLQGTSWQENTYWSHHRGFQWDSEGCVTEIEDLIQEKNIDLLIVDPFHRTYAVDENSASEMGTVWKRIFQLLTKFDQLSIVILHHFSKGGTIYERWASFRGSSRTAAEADLGIFIEKLPRSEGNGIRMLVDGRAIPILQPENGDEAFKLEFKDTGTFVPNLGKITISKWRALVAELEERDEWEVIEAAKYFEVTANTIHTWVAKAIDPETHRPIIVVEKPAPGRPSLLRLVREDNDE